METLFIFLVKSSGLIGVFFLSYHILLRKETFFNSNRWFLLAGLISSVVLPLVVFTKIVWVDPTPTNFDWSKIPMTTPAENEASEINWYLVLAIVYSIGIVVFLIKFAFDFYSLSKVLKGKNIQQQVNFKFIDVNENIAPFSYFNSIVYNSSLYSGIELENILEHEKVHSAQNHTVDVLISRLFCIVFWFNPLVWLYKKAIVQNLEFIADSEASKNISDKKAYQLTLLKITTQENCVAITNHFYQSLIKKRIVMLNKNQSNKRNSWKYAVIIPALVAFVFLFQVKAVAQEKAEKNPSKAVSAIIVGFSTDKNATDEEMKNDTKVAKEQLGIDYKFSNVKRNDKGEIIVIKIEYKTKEGKSGKIELDSDNPIEPIYFNTDGDKVGFSKNNFFNSSDENSKIVSKSYKDAINIIGETNENTATAIAVEAKFSENETYNHIDAINNNKEINAKKALILFDGNEISYYDLDKIDMKTISSSGSFVASHAVKKYGDKGKNGVIFINTKNYDSEHFPYLREMQEKENNKSSKNAVLNITSADGTNYHSEKEKADLFVISTINQSADNFDNKTISKQKPIIILNGKKTEANFDISNIDVNQIETMKVLKGQKAIEKYGKEAENGVIEIITKGNIDLLTSSSKKEQDRKEDIKSRKFEIQARKDEIQSRKDKIQGKKDAIQAKIDAKQAAKDAEQAKKDAIQNKTDR
jgi:hypothetical protein